MPSLDFLPRRSILPQIAIGLGLEGRGSDRPKPRSAPQPFARDGRVHISRAGDRARAVESLYAFDRGHLREADLSRPGVNGAVS